MTPAKAAGAGAEAGSAAANVTAKFCTAQAADKKLSGAEMDNFIGRCIQGAKNELENHCRGGTDNNPCKWLQ